MDSKLPTQNKTYLWTRSVFRTDTKTGVQSQKVHQYIETGTYFTPRNKSTFRYILFYCIFLLFNMIYLFLIFVFVVFSFFLLYIWNVRKINTVNSSLHQYGSKYIWANWMAWTFNSHNFTLRKYFLWFTASVWNRVACQFMHYAPPSVASNFNTCSIIFSSQV